MPFSFAAVTVNDCPLVTVITSGAISTHTAGEEAVVMVMVMVAMAMV